MAKKIADRVEYFMGKDRLWYVRTLSSNGREILRSSEGYLHRDYAKQVAEDTGLPVTEQQRAE